MMAKKGSKKETTFEEDLERLEEIIGALESGDRSLEDAISLYEEGMALSKRCGVRLDQTESRIEKLMEKEGKVEKEKFTE